MPKKPVEAAETKPAARKRITRRKPVEPTQPIDLAWDHVATRAYYIGLEQGGDPVENWLRAERELIAA
jgi:hypothetical protein